MLVLSVLLLPPACQPAQPTPTPFRDLLDCDTYRDALDRLAELPMPCTSFDRAQHDSGASVGVQPTHGLMGEANCLLKAVTESLPSSPPRKGGVER